MLLGLSVTAVAHTQTHRFVLQFHSFLTLQEKKGGGGEGEIGGKKKAKKRKKQRKQNKTKRVNAAKMAIRFHTHTLRASTGFGRQESSRLLEKQKHEPCICRLWASAHQSNAKMGGLGQVPSMDPTMHPPVGTHEGRSSEGERGFHFSPKLPGLVGTDP